MTLGRLTEGRHQEGAVRRGGEGAHVWPVGSMTGSREELEGDGAEEALGRACLHGRGVQVALAEAIVPCMALPAVRSLLGKDVHGPACGKFRGLSPNLVKAMILQGTQLITLSRSIRCCENL